MEAGMPCFGCNKEIDGENIVIIQYYSNVMCYHRMCYMYLRCNECGQNSNPENNLGHVNEHTHCHYMCLRCDKCGQNSNPENNLGHVIEDMGHHYLCLE